MSFCDCSSRDGLLLGLEVGLLRGQLGLVKPLLLVPGEEVYPVRELDQPFLRVVDTEGDVFPPVGIPSAAGFCRDGWGDQRDDQLALPETESDLLSDYGRPGGVLGKHDYYRRTALMASSIFGLRSCPTPATSYSARYAAKPAASILFRTSSTHSNLRMLWLMKSYICAAFCISLSYTLH